MNKTLKKSLSIILTILMIVTTIPFAFAADVAASGSCGDDVTWTRYSDGLLTISGTGDIDDYSFLAKSNIKNVVIEEGITSIGNDAFRDCKNLESVTISDSVISIGADAFNGCTSIASITVGENNEYYSSDEYGVLFNKDKTILIQYPAGNSRTEYVIPDSVRNINTSAFYYCTSLASVTIPDSVTSIGHFAFSGCNSLASVHYLGTSDQWNKISIRSNNTNLTKAEKHYCTKTQEAIDATCTADGYTAGWYCSKCNEDIIIGEKIEALGHSFTDYIEIEAAKCGVAGKEEAKCNNGCGATDEKEIPALSHADADGDNVCDNCDYTFGCEYCEKEHKSIIDDIICKIKRFFVFLSNFLAVVAK